ncbi:MAG: iron-containing alcohol dehydrogenase [Dehalococcoidales bacterium]|jgi:3-dehydroquinate synthase|nr:iron-containing alcohol dehydrogenase [Dehalococcoidales bacterium]
MSFAKNRCLELPVSLVATNQRNKVTQIETLEYDIAYNATRKIHMGNDILEALPDYVRELSSDRFFIITDTDIEMGLLARVENILSRVAKTHQVPFSAGESSKTLSTLEAVATKILDAGATKTSVIVCLGGGVVGNLGGLLAALLFRGMRFFHIPTTLIAQIDSAIGIKQAVNYKKGKNLFGQYYPPEFVFIDFAALRSLPERHIKAGIAESVKHALCQETDFFDFLKQHAGNYSWETIEIIARHTIKLKLKLLKLDPFEGKLDPQLELGHTIGHAIEIIKMGGLLHGEAIAIGMVVETRLSLALGYMAKELQDEIESIFQKIGLPTKIPADISIDQIIQILKYDNKRKTARNDFALLEDFTKFHKTNGKIGTKVTDVILRKVLENCY